MRLAANLLAHALRILALAVLLEAIDTRLRRWQAARLWDL